MYSGGRGAKEVTYPLAGRVFLKDFEFEGFAVCMLRIPCVFRDAVDEADHVMFPDSHN